MSLATHNFAVPMGQRGQQKALSSPMLSVQDSSSTRDKPKLVLKNESLPKEGTVKSIAKIFDQICVNRPVPSGPHISVTLSAQNLSTRKVPLANMKELKISTFSERNLRKLPSPKVYLKPKLMVRKLSRKSSAKKSFSCEDFRTLRTTANSQLLGKKSRSQLFNSSQQTAYNFEKFGNLKLSGAAKSPQQQPPKVLPKPKSPRSTLTQNSENGMKPSKTPPNAIAEETRISGLANSPKPLPPPKPVVFHLQQQLERNVDKNVSFLHSSVKSATGAVKSNRDLIDCSLFQSGLKKNSNSVSPPLETAALSFSVERNLTKIPTGNICSLNNSAEQSDSENNMNSAAVTDGVVRTESDYAIYEFRPALCSSSEAIHKVSTNQQDSGVMTLNGSQLDISGHIYCAVNNGVILDESFCSEEQFEEVDDEPINTNIPADEVALRRASGTDLHHGRLYSGDDDSFIGRKRRSQSLTDAVFEVFDLLRQAPNIPPPLPPARMKSEGLDSDREKTAVVGSSTTAKIGPPTLPKTFPPDRLSGSISIEDYAEITGGKDVAENSSGICGCDDLSISSRAMACNSAELINERQSVGLIGHKISDRISQSGQQKVIISRDSAMTQSMIVLPEYGRAHSEDRTLPEEPNKECVGKETSSHRGLKKFVKKLRPVSQQFQDMGKLFRIRSDIQVNMAKTVGSIKLKVSSNSKRTDVTKSSVFYMRSPGEDKSETGRSSPDGTCSSGEQGGIEPPVPPPRSTSIRITVEATTNRSGSSTTSSNESQPQVTSKFCVTDGKTPREKIRRGPILGRRRHTVDDNVINECRERDYDRDFADDFSSDIETSSDEGNETADDSFAASSKTSSSPTGENLDLTGVVKGIRLSDEEKSATLKAVSTLNNNFPSLDLDPEPDADGVDHIYNSRFAFSEPLYQVYRKENAAKIYRTQTISSADNNNSAKAQRREMMVQASTLGSQRSLWCEIPEVKRAGLLETLSSQERKAQEAMFEIITSEASYLKSLNVLITHFMASHEFSGKPGSVLSSSERRILFSNILAVRDASENLLCALENKLEQSLVLTNIASVVAEHLTKDTEIYVKYCSNQIYQERMLNSLRKTNSEFLRSLEILEKQPSCQGLSMRSFMLLPMQRVTRYPLLLDAVYRHTGQDSTDLESAKRAMSVATRLVTMCNDGAKRIERMEQLMELEKKLIFGDNVRAVPLVSATRWLVKQGVVHHIYYKHQTRTIGRRMTASSLAAPPRSRPLHLFLLTDLLLVTKKRKHADVFVILDYAARNMVEATNLELSCSQVPPGTSAILPISSHGCLYSLTLMRNHNEKQIELVVVSDTETEKARWVEAFQPPKSEGLEDIYETWDCPQAVASVDVVGTQEDELSLEAGDVLNILRRTRDGWCEGERLRDGVRGWFQLTNVVEIVSDHVRAKNFRLRLRLLQAAGIVQGASSHTSPVKRSKALQ